MRYFKKYRSICMIAFMLLTSTTFYSCDIDSAVNKITKAIDNAVSELNQNSSEWQDIMDDLILELGGIDDSLSSLISNDVQNLLDRGVAVVGSEFRCNVDFIGNRMRNALLRIEKEYLNSSTIAPELKPYVCDAVPSSVERIEIGDTVNTLEFFGYDFDLSGLKLYVEKSNGTREDVTSYLVKPTHYQMTVDLGTEGLELTSQDDKFVLAYLANEFSELSLIKIIQGTTKMDSVSPGSRTFIPPHTNGDVNFSSSPAITCRVNLSILGVDQDQLWSSIYMKALETGSDLTTLEGTDTHLIYTAPSGKQIKEISCLTIDNLPDYTDTDTEKDYFERGSGGPVERYEIVGQADGSDAGATQVIVEYNTIPIELEAAD